MTYQQVKAELDIAKQNVLSKHNELNRIKEELVSLATEKGKLHSVYEQKILDAKRDAMQKSKQAAMEPLESKLNTAELELEKLKTDYVAVKKDLTFDNLYQKYTSKQEILDEVKDSVEVLRGRIEAILGKNFLERLSSHLEKKSIDLESADLKKLVNYFNQCSEKMDSFANKPTSILSTINDVEQHIAEATAAGDRDKTTLSVLALIAIIFTIFAYKYVFPVYVLCISLFSVYSLICSYNVYKILIVQKAVQDNIDGIEQLLRNMVQEELDAQIRDVDEKYSEAIQNTESQIKQLREQLNAVSAKSEYSYDFDASALKNEEVMAAQRLDSKESDLLLTQKTVEKEYNDWTERANSLKKQLNNIVGDIQTDYLSFDKVCLNTIFEPRFLFDIDAAKSKPIYFEHPETSCLFLYRDYEDVTDFVRLMCVQLRSKLNPFNLSITIIDTVNIGQCFVYFLPTQMKKEEDLSNLFSIISDENGLADRFFEYNEDIKRRQQNISKEFSNIAEYNKRMIELDSLTEEYDFLFVLDPDDSMLTNSDLMRVLRNGGSLGIFGHVFIKIDKFGDMGDSAKELLECIGKTYLLQNGNFNERAKDFILDYCLKKE